MDVEGIIWQLDDVLDNHEVDEIGITLDPTLPDIVHMEGKLGIAKECLKALFKHSLSKLYELKFLRTELSGTDLVQSILSISRVVLLIKGDFPVAFEMRKNLITQSLYDARREIPFTTLVFSRHPKCPSGWQHRRWCLQHRNQQESRLSCSQIETERQLCSLMAEKHPKNYYAWVHRLWLLQFMNSYQLEDELAFTKEWLYSHVSDHSAVNHRIQVIVHILACPRTLPYIVKDVPPPSTEAPPPTLTAEDTLRLSTELLCRMLAESEELLTSRPGHESLWSLRRALWEMLLTHTARYLQGQGGADSVLESLGDQTVEVASVESNTELAGSNLAVIGAALADFVIQCRSAGAQTAADDRPDGRLAQCVCKLVAYELRLVEVCSDEASAAWDGAMQSLLAARYAAFLLSRLAFYTCRSEESAQNVQDASTFGSWVQRQLETAKAKLHARGATPFQRT